MFQKRQSFIYFLLCTFPSAANLIIHRTTQILNVPCLPRASLKSMHKTFLLDLISLLKGSNLKTNMLGSICTLLEYKPAWFKKPATFNNPKPKEQPSQFPTLADAKLQQHHPEKQGQNSTSCRGVPLGLLCRCVLWAHSSLQFLSPHYGALAHHLEIAVLLIPQIPWTWRFFFRKGWLLLIVCSLLFQAVRAFKTVIPTWFPFVWESVWCEFSRQEMFKAGFLLSRTAFWGCVLFL